MLGGVSCPGPLQTFSFLTRRIAASLKLTLAAKQRKINLTTLGHSVHSGGQECCEKR